MIPWKSLSTQTRRHAAELAAQGRVHPDPNIRRAMIQHHQSTRDGERRWGGPGLLLLTGLLVPWWALFPWARVDRSLPIYLVLAGALLVLSVLDRVATARYRAGSLLAAANLFAEADSRSGRAEQWEVHKPASAAWARFFGPVWILLLGVNGVLSYLRGPANVPAAVQLGGLALLAVIVVLLGVGSAQLWRTHPRNLLSLGAKGIELVDYGLTVDWSEVDDVDIVTPKQPRELGLALKLHSPDATLARLSRRHWSLRAEVERRGGWIFVPETQMREPLLDVMTQAMRWRRPWQVRQLTAD